jgi:hypothetical protein
MKKGKKIEKVQKKKGKRKAFWITVVIHSDFDVGNNDSLTPFRVLLI